MDNEKEKYLPNDAFYGGWVPFMALVGCVGVVGSFILSLIH
jgi:hypothetical protein